MPLVCSFTVLGQAVPQGSLTDYGHGLTYSNRASVMQWRQDIRTAVQLHVPQLLHALVRGPVAVRVRFAIPKPPSVPKRRVFPTVAPDCDKLLRALGDALQHTVIRDDAQIVHWDAWKIYTEGRAQATIDIWQPDELVPAADANPFQQPGLF